MVKAAAVPATRGSRLTFPDQVNSDTQSGLEAFAPSAQTILVVNDDEDALFLLEHALRRVFPEARLLTADNGKEGLEVWRRERLDGVITDNRMPEISGILLTRKIREVDTELPIVMMTCSAQDQAEALAAGVTVFYPENDLDGGVQCLKQCLDSVKKHN